VRLIRKNNLFGKSRMGFVADLAFGNKWQQWYISRAQPQEVEIKEGNFKAYDAILDGEKYEFKAEKLIAKYGNICIEYLSRGNPSGISSTEADYYVIMSIENDSVKEMWKVPTAEIKRLISEKAYHRDTAGGDGWANQMLLFKKGTFAPWLLPISSPNP